MIDLVPAYLYTGVFNQVVLALIIIALLECFSGSLFKSDVRAVNNILAYIIVVGLIFYMGLRPISSYFGDTVNYAQSFYNLQDKLNEFSIKNDGEWIFNTLMYLFAKHSNLHAFFLCCATIYVGALWWTVKRIFKEDAFVPFVVVMGMFTFWAYGVNGIRNGMAASIVILALTFREKKVIAILLAFVALGIHKSLSLMIMAAAISMFFRDPKVYLKIWLGCIVLSVIAGNTLANAIVNSGFIADDRFASYLAGDAQDEFSHTGFRWDFLAFSSLPVVIGAYLILKREYTDRFYIWLFNIYLVTNAFWIIVIRASFSNRFAQISWFLMPFVIIYPFFMKKFWNDQQIKTGYVIIASYLYTFYLEFLS